MSDRPPINPIVSTACQEACLSHGTQRSLLTISDGNEAQAERLRARAEGIARAQADRSAITGVYPLTFAQVVERMYELWMVGASGHDIADTAETLIAAGVSVEAYAMLVRI